VATIRYFRYENIKEAYKRLKDLPFHTEDIRIKEITKKEVILMELKNRLKQELS